MKKLAAVLAAACASLALAGAASSAPAYGVAEDATKYAPDGGAALFAQMGSYGLTSNRMAVFWDPSQPTDTIYEKSFLDRAVPEAAKAGVQVVFAVYPLHPTDVTSTPNGPQRFCDYIAGLATTYPTVTKLIVGNEPNQPRFWRPQFDGSGKPLSGAQYEGVLARCYDALKAVNPAIDVIGVGLSPRGNDDPTAANNISQSPVKFLKGMGDAYRASARTAPIMDELAFHCYPNVNTDSLQRGYQWPNVGCVNLDRVKQAVWDAFHGTGQPTFAEGSVRRAAGFGDALTLVLDEIGWQVKVITDLVNKYSGKENVPLIDEAAQAQIYSQLATLVACDPSITALHYFHLIDESDLDRFQSGLFRIDDSARSAASAVQAVIVQGCTQGITAWRHKTKVAGAAAGRTVANGRRAVDVKADEQYTFTAVVSKRGHTASATGSGRAYWDTNILIPRGFRGGTMKVTLRAWANPGRTSTFTVNV